MSLSYQHALQTALFELSTQVGIIRNKLCDIKRELDSFNTTDISQKTDISSLQETLTSIQTQSINLSNSITIIDDNIDIVADLNINATTGINIFQSPHKYKINAEGNGLWFENGADIIKIPFGTEITSAGVIVLHT
jgi:hypothetical protein